jgi:hypothetical protein
MIMKSITNTIFTVLLVVAGLIMPARAEVATMNESLNVANNWITLIIRNKGSWGDANSAFVEDIQEFKRGHRRLGYFCRVQPEGFIVISLHKALAPVKAYSDVGNLSPDCDAGMTDLIKGGMERVLNRIEAIIGKIESASIEDFQNTLEINYRGAWDELQINSASFQQQLDSGVTVMDYQGGEIMLTSSWQQGDPYNILCPSGDGCDHVPAGCHAIATSQIMRYWAWPPWGEGSRHGASFSDSYDWLNMPDSVWASSPSVQIDAVSELVYEVGEALDNIWSDCDGTATQYYEVDTAFQDYFRYLCQNNWEDRVFFGGVEWFNRMKGQLNANRPVQYTVPDHAIVGDGWQEIGSTPIRQYHMNYGWGGGVMDPSHPKYCSDWAAFTNSNAWYTLDALPCTDEGDERMLERIRPARSLSVSLAGSYPRDATFPYRYFDRDATGNTAIFEAGHNLQFLPRVTVTGTSTTSGYIQFQGSSSLQTRLFSIKGTDVAGVHVNNGGIRLYENGSIKFH